MSERGGGFNEKVVNKMCVMRRLHALTTYADNFLILQLIIHRKSFFYLSLIAVHKLIKHAFVKPNIFD